MNERFTRMVATGFGSGFAPLAPGTAGTVVGLPLALLFSTLPWPLGLLSVLAFTAFAWRVADEAERIYGQKDAPCIVIDEIAGLQWALLFVAPTVPRLLLGFLLFRLFDIVKPPPARLFERRLPGGFGVVADDLVAGLYANLALWAIGGWLVI